MNLNKLIEKRQKILEKLHQLENDLKKPLKMNLDANALEEENREILNGIYQVEKVNLEKLNADIGSV